MKSKICLMLYHKVMNPELYEGKEMMADKIHVKE